MQGGTIARILDLATRRTIYYSQLQRDHVDISMYRNTSNAVCVVYRTMHFGGQLVHLGIASFILALN